MVPPYLVLFFAVTGEPALILRRSSRCAPCGAFTIRRSLSEADKRYCFRIRLKDRVIIPHAPDLSTVILPEKLTAALGFGIMEEDRRGKHEKSQDHRNGKPLPRRALRRRRRLLGRKHLSASLPLALGRDLSAGLRAAERRIPRSRRRPRPFF